MSNQTLEHCKERIASRVKNRTLWTAAVGLAVSIASTDKVYARDPKLGTCSGGGINAVVALPTKVDVSATLPVGGMLTPWTYSPSHTGVFNCTSNTTIDWRRFYNGSKLTYVGSKPAVAWAAAPSPAYTQSRVYATNVAGVGLAVAAKANRATWNNTSIPNSPGGTGGIAGSTTGERTGVVGGQAAFALVKTGNISPGTVTESGAIIEMTPYAIAYLPGECCFGAPPGGTWASVYYRMSPVQIVPGTCNLAAGDVNRTIALDTVRLSSFIANWIGKKTFDITADCSNALNVTFRFTGTPASGNSALFASTGDARGVGLWLYSRIGGVESTISHNGTRTVAVSGTKAVLPMGAAYHKTTGALTKGSLASTVTVNITYN